MCYSYNKTHVDKFGRSDNRIEAPQSEITFTNVSNTFLKRDDSNTVADTIDMDSHSITNIADPATNQDASSKNYADKNTVIVNDGVVRSDINLDVGSRPIKKLGCFNIIEGKTFALILVTDTNSQISPLHVVELKTDGVFLYRSQWTIYMCI